MTRKLHTESIALFPVIYRIHALSYTSLALKISTLVGKVLGITGTGVDGVSVLFKLFVITLSLLRPRIVEESTKAAFERVTRSLFHQFLHKHLVLFNAIIFRCLNLVHLTRVAAFMEIASRVSTLEFLGRNLMLPDTRIVFHAVLFPHCFLGVIRVFLARPTNDHSTARMLMGRALNAAAVTALVTWAILSASVAKDVAVSLSIAAYHTPKGFSTHFVTTRLTFVDAHCYGPRVCST